MDPAVARMWRIAQVCEVFGCTPLQAKHELADDPEHLAEILPVLLRYRDLKGVFDSAQNDDKALKPYADSRLMGVVKTNTMRRRGRLLAARKAAMHTPVR